MYASDDAVTLIGRRTQGDVFMTMGLSTIRTPYYIHPYTHVLYI